MLVSALHNFCRRFRSCNDCRVQNLRCVTVNYHIGEVERYAFASLDARNRVGVVTVIGDAIHSHEVQCALAVEEVLDCDILSIALAVVLDSNRVVQGITDSGFTLIYALRQNKVRNLCFGLGTRNLNIDRIRRNLLIVIDGLVRVFTVTGVVRVFGVRSGNISRSDVFQNLSRHITNFNRVGVGQSDRSACGNLSDMELTVFEGVVRAVNASDFASEVVGIGYYNIVNIEALVVGNGDIVGDDLTRLSHLLVRFLVDGDSALIGYDHINSRRIKFHGLAVLRVCHISLVLKELLIIALYHVGIGDVDSLPCSDFRNRPSVIAVIGVLVCIGGIDAANKVIGILDSDIRLCLGIGVIHADGVSHDFIDKCELLVSRLGGFERRVNGRCRDDSGVQDLRLIAFHDNIGEAELHECTGRQFVDGVSAITVHYNTDSRDVVELAVSIEEVFNQNILQFAIADIRHLNGVMQHIANRSALLVNKLLDLQLALRRVDRNGNIIAGNLDDDLIRRLRLLVLRGLILISEPVMQRSHILQFVVSILTLTGIRVQHNVIIFYRDSLASRNSTDLDNCRTGRDRFQSAILHIRYNAAEVVLVVQRCVHIVDSVIVVQGDGVMHRITDVCNALVSLFYNGGTNTLRRGLFGNNGNINLIGGNRYLAGVGHISHLSGIDEHIVRGILVHYCVGVDDVYALTSADRGDVPNLVANIAYDIGVLGRRDNAREVVRILDLNIRLGLVGRIGNGNGVGHNLADLNDLFVCFLLDFGNIRNLDSSIVYGALVAFLYGVGDRNLNGLTSRNLCDGEGVSSCIVGVLIGADCVDFANAIIEVADYNVRNSQLTGVRGRDGVVDSITDHGTRLARGLDDLHFAAFRNLTNMDRLSVRVARNGLAVRVLALCNSRIHDVAAFEVDVLCNRSVDIGDFNGLASVQLSNHPLAIAIIHQVAGVLDCAIAVGCIGNDNIRQLGIAAVLDGQCIGDGSIIAIQVNEALIRLLLDVQTIAQHIDLYGVRRLCDVLVARNLGIGILRGMSGSNIDDGIGVTILYNVQVVQRDGIANIQNRDGEQLGFGVVAISITGSDDEHAQSIGVIGDGDIRHVDGAIVRNSDLILDDFAGISVVAVCRLDNRQVLVVQRYDYLIGIDRFLRNSRVFASGNRCGSNIIQLAVCEVFCNNRVLVGDGNGLTGTKAGNCPSTIIIDAVAEVDLRVLNGSTHEVVLVLYDHILQSGVARIRDLQLISDDVAYSSFGLVCTLLDGQVLTDDFDINIGSLDQPILVRLGVVRGLSAIGVFSVALDYLHIGNLSVIFKDVVVVRAVVSRVDRVGVAECHDIGMSSITQMRNLIDDELAIVGIVGNAVCLRQNRRANEVVRILHDHIMQVMARSVRNGDGIANHFVIRCTLTVSSLLDGDAFLVTDGQRAVNILDGVVGVAARAIHRIDDDCITGNIGAGTDLGLRTDDSNRIHLVMDAELFVVDQLRSIGIAGFRQRRSVIDLLGRVGGDGDHTRVDEEATGSNGANLDVRNFRVGRNNRIAGVLGADILTGDTSSVEVQGAVNVIAQVLARLVLFILLVREGVRNFELIGVVVTVGLAVVFSLDIDNQGLDGQLSVDVNEVVVRVMECRILSGYRILANRAPLLCVSLGLQCVLAADVIDGIAALEARDGDIGSRVIFAEILLVVDNRDNDSCGHNRQRAGSRDDFVVAGRVSTINGDGILAYLLAVISIRAGTLRGDIEEVFVTGIDQLFGVSNRPSQRVRVFLSVNLLLVVSLHMDRLLTDSQVAANIDELVVAVVSNQLLLVVVDGIVANLRLIGYRVASGVVAVERSRTGDLGLIVLDAGAGLVLHITTNKSGDGISEVRNLIAIGGAVAAVDLDSQRCGHDFQRAVNDGHIVVLVVHIVLSGNEVVSVKEGRAPLVERICSSDITAHHILALCTIELKAQRAVFGVNQTNHIPCVIFITIGKCRVSRAVGLHLVVNADNQFLRVDRDITIHIADNIVLLEVRVRLDLKGRADMLLTVFQNNAIRVHRILIVVASSYDVLASVRQVVAQSSEAKLTVQNGLLRIVALEAGNIGIKCGILFAVGLGVTTLHSNNQLSRSNRKVAVLHGNNVVGDAILADRADIVGVDGVSLAERMLASPDILTGFTSHASTFEVAGLDRHIRAFLLSENGTVCVLDVIVAIFATDTVMERVLQFGVSIAVNLGVIRSNNGNGARNDSQVASGNRDVVIIIDGAVDTGQADATLVSPAGAGLCIQMCEGKGIGVDTGFLCRDFNRCSVLDLEYMIGVVGRAVVEAIDTVAVVADLIIHGNHQTLTLDDEVVCVTVLKVVVRVIQLKLFLVVRCEVTDLTVLRRGVDGIRTDFLTLCTDQIEDDGNLVGVHNNACIRDTAACAELLLSGDGVVSNHIGQGEVLNLILVAELLLPAGDGQQHRTRLDGQNTGRVACHSVVIATVCVLARYENRMLLAIALITIQVVGADIGELVVGEVDVIAQRLLSGLQHLRRCTVIVLQCGINGITVLQTDDIQTIIVRVLLAVVTLLIAKYDCQRDRRNGHRSVVRLDDIVVCRALFVGNADGIPCVTDIFAAIADRFDAEHFAGRLNDFAINGPLECGLCAAVCLRSIESSNANQTRMNLQHIGLVNELVVGDSLSFAVGNGLDAQRAAVACVLIDRYGVSIDRNMAVRVVIVMVVLVTLVHLIVLLKAVSAILSGDIRLIDNITELSSSRQIRQVRDTVRECQRRACRTIDDLNDIADGIAANQLHVVVVYGGVVAQYGPVILVRHIQLIALCIRAQNLECGVEERIRSTVNLLALIDRDHNLARADLDRTGVFCHNIVLQQIVVELVQTNVLDGIRTGIGRLARYEFINELTLILIRVLCFQVEFLIILCSSLVVLNETFHRQPAIRALVPVVDIVCVRELTLETETVSGALALHLRTKRGAVDTTAEGLVGDVVVVVVVVHEVHLVVLLDGTNQSVQVINILYSVLEYDIDRAANRNRVDVELSTILVHTNAVRGLQRNRTVTGKAALQAQILDCDRSNIVVLCCQTVALVLVGDCNGNSHLLSNLRVGRAVAVLHRVRQMANRIGGQTIVAVCFDDAVIAVRIVPSQLLTGIAVSIGANIGLSVQSNSVVVGDVINVDIPLPLFTDSGIVVGVIYLDVVRVNHRILVVILLSLGIAGNIDVFTFTSKNRFVCLFNSHVLTIVRHCVSQILVVSDIIGVSIIVPLVFVRVMVLTMNIQRTRVDGSGEIFFCNIVVVKRVVDKFKNRNRLDAVQTRMELLSEARCCVIFGSVCVAVVTVCQTGIQVNSVAIDDTGVLSRSFNLNILHFSSADIVVNLVVIIAVQIQRARVNVEVDDIALTRHILVRSCALTAYHIGLAGECVLPAERNIVLRASVNCCSSIGAGTNERLLLAVSRSIGGLCNVCRLVVGVYDVDIIENALRNACVSLVPDDRLCNDNRSAIVHLVRNGQLDFDIGRMAFVGILETNVHSVLADTTVQALVKVYNLDFCATGITSSRTIVVC